MERGRFARGWGIGQDLATPAADGLHDLLAQRLNGYRFHQRCRVRPGQSNPMLTDHPPNDNRIAVIRPHKRSTSVVEIPELLAALRVVPQDIPREIGSFQVLRPSAIEAIDTFVHGLQSRDLIV